MGVVRSRTSYNNHNTMTAKGWVSRKREQFESFAKSVDDQNNVITVAKPQSHLQNVGYKPPLQEIKTQATEVTTTKENDAPKNSKEMIKDSIKNIRDEAIRQSSKPSGSVEEETSVVEDDDKNDNTNAGVPTINNNNSQKMQRPQKQQQVTKKMVYTQYREMLKRYEQSSRL